jgi:hypothetical protein
VIRSERPVAAPAAIVHAVLTDVTAWKLWAPHIASVDCRRRRHPRLRLVRPPVKPWFGPRHADGRHLGRAWRAACGGPPRCSANRLEYADLITPDGDDRCLVTDDR